MTSSRLHQLRELAADPEFLSQDLMREALDEIERLRSEHEEPDLRLSEQARERRHAITVWHWEDAPERFRALSDNGGDEDFVALVPVEFRDREPSWLHSEGFGCCCVDRHETDEGIVFIGAHS